MADSSFIGLELSPSHIGKKQTQVDPCPSGRRDTSAKSGYTKGKTPEIISLAREATPPSPNAAFFRSQEVGRPTSSRAGLLPHQLEYEAGRLKRRLRPRPCHHWTAYGIGNRGFPTADGLVFVSAWLKVLNVLGPPVERLE